MITGTHHAESLNSSYWSNKFKLQHSFYTAVQYQFCSGYADKAEVWGFNAPSSTWSWNEAQCVCCSSHVAPSSREVRRDYRRLASLRDLWKDKRNQSTFKKRNSKIFYIFISWRLFWTLGPTSITNYSGSAACSSWYLLSDLHLFTSVHFTANSDLVFWITPFNFGHLKSFSLNLKAVWLLSRIKTVFLLDFCFCSCNFHHSKI